MPSKSYIVYSLKSTSSRILLFLSYKCVRGIYWFCHRSVSPATTLVALQVVNVDKFQMLSIDRYSQVLTKEGNWRNIFTFVDFLRSKVKIFGYCVTGVLGDKLDLV
jgi:hypothetical protein